MKISGKPEKFSVNFMVIDSFKAKAIEKKQIKLHFLYLTGKQF